MQIHFHQVTFPFYDDEYRHVHYDDDNDSHVLHDIILT